MNLALFDLDHTLLPLDSDYEWGEFLARNEVINATTFRAANNQWYKHYQAGNLDPIKYLEFSFKILASFDRQQIDMWQKKFIKEIIQPSIQPTAIELVQHHFKTNDLVAIVTATNSFIATPIAKLFNIQHLIAATPEFNHDGRFTGRLIGTPTYGAGKVIHIKNWLQKFNKTLEHFKRSYFYSDSQNDLPLLSVVTHPVATNPNDVLKAHAVIKGWPILNLF